MVSTTATHCHTLKMAAGCPLKSIFSVSESLAIATVCKSELQNLHFNAAFLIVSAQKGQILVSSFVIYASDAGADAGGLESTKGFALSVRNPTYRKKQR